MKVTRARPGQVIGEETLQDKARRLLEQREAERRAKLSPRGGNPEAQALMRRNREPALNIHTEERGDNDELVVKAGKPREYPFQIKVRIYGPMPDKWNVNDILYEALREARNKARAKYGADIWTSLIMAKPADQEGLEEQEVE